MKRYPVLTFAASVVLVVTWFGEYSLAADTLNYTRQVLSAESKTSVRHH